MSDPVNSPSHYMLGGIEVIDAIEAWDLGVHEANVVKYVARAKYKGNELQDLKKARWYLNRKISKLEQVCGPLRCGTCIPCQEGKPCSNPPTNL